MKPSASRYSQHLKLLSANIRKLRLEAKLTQMQLSEKVDIEFKYLQKLESGQVNPSIAVALAVADYFKIKLDDLFVDIPLIRQNRGRPKKNN